jgi:hypothetical protein
MNDSYGMVPDTQELYNMLTALAHPLTGMRQVNGKPTWNGVTYNSINELRAALEASYIQARSWRRSWLYSLFYVALDNPTYNVNLATVDGRVELVRRAVTKMLQETQDSFVFLANSYVSGT